MKKLILILMLSSFSIAESNNTEPRIYMSCYDILQDIESLKKAQKESGHLTYAENIAATTLRIVSYGLLNELINGDPRVYSKKMDIESAIKCLESKLRTCSAY